MAQERYRAAHRQYGQNVCDLDMLRPEPTFFAVGELKPGSTGSLVDSWSLALARFSDAFLFGNYTVTFNQNGFDPCNSTVVSRFAKTNALASLLALHAIR